MKTWPTPGLASSADAELPSAPPPRLRGRWLVIARIVWFVLFAVVVGIVIVSIPTYFAYLHTLTASYNPRVEQITQSQRRALENLGPLLGLLCRLQHRAQSPPDLRLSAGWRSAFLAQGRYRMAFVTSAALITFPIGYLSVQTTSLTLPWSWLAQLAKLRRPDQPQHSLLPLPQWTARSHAG